MATEYDLNDTWSPTVTFAVDGVATDPTTVTFVVVPPDQIPDTYTYAGGTVTRSSTGVFTKNITLDQIGIWLITCTGTGACQASAAGTVTVTG